MSSQLGPNPIDFFDWLKILGNWLSLDLNVVFFSDLDLNLEDWTTILEDAFGLHPHLGPGRTNPNIGPKYKCWLGAWKNRRYSWLRSVSWNRFETFSVFSFHLWRWSQYTTSTFRSTRSGMYPVRSCTSFLSGRNGLGKNPLTCLSLRGCLASRQRQSNRVDYKVSLVSWTWQSLEITVDLLTGSIFFLIIKNKIKKKNSQNDQQG